MTTNKLFKLKCFIVLFTSCAIVEATTLAIDPEPQPGANVCWAACSDMLLKYYGNPPNMHGIWVRGTNSVDDVNGLCEYYPATWLNVQEILSSGNPVKNVSSTCHGGVELSTDLTNDIQSCKPVMAGLSDNIVGHLVLIKGYETNGNVYYNDPATGTVENRPYDLFCSNSRFYWTESLIPNDGSPVCLVPVDGASIDISSGPTQFAYPGSNATYKSSFHCPSGQTCMPPSLWNWTLSFFHNGGSYTVASVQNLYGSGTSTWNVSAFNLPTSGYQWQYNAAGLVMGMVNVSSSDGYFDWESVTYAPQILIPGHVTFNNQTVSGYHPEIDAHFCIDINNVVVNTGAAITFKAGTCCSIDNLTVNNGSNVTIQIDPSLQ